MADDWDGGEDFFPRGAETLALSAEIEPHSMSHLRVIAWKEIPSTGLRPMFPLSNAHRHG